jgi:hypothetical protein
MRQGFGLADSDGERSYCRFATVSNFVSYRKFPAARFSHEKKKGADNEKNGSNYCDCKLWQLSERNMACCTKSAVQSPSPEQKNYPASVGFALLYRASRLSYQFVVSQLLKHITNIGAGQPTVRTYNPSL